MASYEPAIEGADDRPFVPLDDMDDNHDEIAGGTLGTAPAHPVTSYVLCTDPASRLLLVQAAGDGTWHLPGGVMEIGESPLEAARREVGEELGLTLDLLADDLLGVEWAQARRRDRLVFLWAGPMLSTADTDRIALQERELSAWRWADADEARRLLHPAVAARIRTPLQWPGRVTYQETRHERTESNDSRVPSQDPAHRHA